MTRWWLAIVLVVASAAAWADPSPDQVTATDRGEAKAADAERAYNTVANAQQSLKRQFDDQVAAVDSLKKRKRSWRHDQELDAAQADATDTAKKLESMSADLAAKRQAMTAARRSL